MYYKEVFVHALRQDVDVGRQTYCCSNCRSFCRLLNRAHTPQSCEVVCALLCKAFVNTNVIYTSWPECVFNANRGTSNSAESRAQREVKFETVACFYVWRYVPRVGNYWYFCSLGGLHFFLCEAQYLHHNAVEITNTMHKFAPLLYSVCWKVRRLSNFTSRYSFSDRLSLSAVSNIIQHSTPAFGVSIACVVRETELFRFSK
jgi:hypothetical protein